MTAVRGVAGSGKTAMLDQAVRAIAELSGLDVMAFAPSASATEILRKQELKSTTTVQKLFADPELQRLASGKILLVDEAGFLSVRQMRQLVSFAAGNNCSESHRPIPRQLHRVLKHEANSFAGQLAQAHLWCEWITAEERLWKCFLQPTTLSARCRI